MARKNNGEPKTFAYEEFMARARKEGRVRNEELSMKVLKPDLSLQARVNHIDVDHVRALHDILKNGQPLAPIIVFEIDGPKGKTFKIADGFHRHEVYKRDGKPGIPCVVVSGTLQEAIEYAASANQTLSLRRKPEDVRKAICLLFDNGWFTKSARLTSIQAGCSQALVLRVLAEYAEKKNTPVPAVFTTSNGRSVRRGLAPGTQSKGGQIYFGGSKYKSKAAFTESMSARSGASSALERGQDLANFFARAGLHLQATPSLRIPIYAVRGTALTPMTATPQVGVGLELEITHAIGRAVVAMRWFDSAACVVLTPGKIARHDKLFSVARQLGVEFMTLDEFVAAVKAEQRDSAPVAANA